MEELVTEFKSESNMLIGQLLDLLEEIEGEPGQVRRLEQFGQIVDRMMGTSKSMALALDELKDQLNSIGTYCELCKQVSYKSARVTNNEELYNVVVALLMDATEMLQKMVNGLGESSSAGVRGVLNATFLDRLRWVNNQVNKASGAPSNEKTADVEGLLKALMG